jgi:FKBP-type peptidyl-prolyl cis-trans isomerase FkpA
MLMRQGIVAGLALALAGSAGCRSPEPQTSDEKAIYALGARLGQQAAPLRLTPDEVEILKRAVGDAARGDKLLLDPTVYGSAIQELLRKRSAGDVGQEKLRGLAFQTQAALEPGAVKTESGLIFRTLEPGRGKSPTGADTVTVHYKGTLTSGKPFDSSHDRGQPLEFTLDKVIPCWGEGLLRMKVGEKAKLVCPPEIAYGDMGSPPAIPGGATLVFEVELLGIAPPR